MLRDVLRRLGPIAWRDARIEELLTKVRAQQGRIEELREQRRAAPAPRPPARPAGRYRPTVPSWHARIMEQQRVQRAVNALPGSEQHPRRNLFRKLHNYELARSLGVDRKSTRLNSSHVAISYAVFCVKTNKQRHTFDSV